MNLVPAKQFVSILFVDENSIEISPFRRLLEARGHDVDQAGSAHSAYDRLMSGEEFDLVVVDVMLAPGSGTSDRFSSEHTDRRMETGITLVSALIDDGCPLPYSRLAFFTHVERAKTLAKAKKLKADFGIELWHKAQFIDDPLKFIQTAEKQAMLAK